MIDYLLKTLATYKVFERNVHVLHWMARGPINGDFHLRMKDAYEYAQTVEDDTAERIMQLGGEIPLKMCDIMAQSSMEFLGSISDMESSIKSALDVTQKIIELDRAGVEKAIECKDFHTEDLFRERLARHEIFYRKLSAVFHKVLPPISTT